MTPRRQPPPKRALPPSLLAAGVALAAAVAVALALVLLGDDDAGGVVAGERVLVPVEGFSDVHGLAVHPANPDEVFVATHQGLMRGVGGEWRRVGTMQDDLMGFSMHPTDGATFWTSGHPQGGGNMGVRQSTDGGFTWVTLWDERVDFHAMTVSPADPERLWGFYAGRLYHSEDGGHRWRVVSDAPPPMRALAAHPADASSLYATTQGGIAASADGGRTWSVLAAVPALGVAPDPTDAQVLYAGGSDALWKSTDGGRTWRALDVPAPGAYAYLAVSPSDPRVVYAATYGTGVYRSADAGGTWTQLKAPSR